MQPQELDAAREIFSTGNYGKVMPCTRYGDRELPIGPVATRARELYMEFAASLPRLARVAGPRPASLRRMRIWHPRMRQLMLEQQTLFPAGTAATATAATR